MARAPARNEPLHWVESAGGPFVVGCASVMAHWRGVDEEPIKRGRSRTPSDYDRASAVDGYLGLIDGRGGQLLVLGDQPMQSAFTQTVDGGLAIARWHSSDFDVAASDAATRTFDLSMPEVAPRLTLRVASAVLLMMDSACRLDLQSDTVTGVKIVPGQYRVRTVWHTGQQAGRSFKFLIHQFSKIGL